MHLSSNFSTITESYSLMLLPKCTNSLLYNTTQDHESVSDVANRAAFVTVTNWQRCHSCVVDRPDPPSESCRGTDQLCHQSMCHSCHQRTRSTMPLLSLRDQVHHSTHFIDRPCPSCHYSHSATLEYCR